MALGNSTGHCECARNPGNGVLRAVSAVEMVSGWLGKFHSPRSISKAAKEKELLKLGSCVAA